MMKNTSFIAGLQKSTRMTVISCAFFLAMTAVIMLFLMICPVEIKSHHLPTQNNNNTIQEGTAESASTSDQYHEYSGSEAPHELSTWAVTFDRKEYDQNYNNYNGDDSVYTQDAYVPNYDPSIEGDPYNGGGLWDTEYSDPGNDTTYTQTVSDVTDEPGNDPNVPDATDAPDDPNVPDTPDIPDDPNVPDTPDTPDDPNVPDNPVVDPPAEDESLPIENLL